MKTKASVLLAGAVPPPHHGSTIYFDRLLNSVLKNRFSVYHVDLSDHRGLSNISKLDMLNVFIALRGILRLLKLIVSKKPDIIYIPISPSFLPYLRDALLILCARWFSNAGIIAHYHGGKYFRDEFYQKSNRAIRWFIRYSCQQVDRMLVLSDGLIEVFSEFDIPTTAVPNGIPYREISDRTNPSEKVKVVFLANMIRSKGILRLIEAAEILVKHRLKMEFHIIGDWWSQDGDVKQILIAAEKRLKGQLIIHGALFGEEKYSILDHSDIFVLPTSNDGFPLSILEAMSASLPVVSSKGIGSIPEIIEQDKTGILIDPMDISEIVHAIEYLAENVLIREEMGRAGRKRYEDMFLDTMHFEKISDAFMRVLDVRQAE